VRHAKLQRLHHDICEYPGCILITSGDLYHLAFETSLHRWLERRYDRQLRIEDLNLDTHDTSIPFVQLLSTVSPLTCLLITRQRCAGLRKTQILWAWNPVPHSALQR
jgi:hypothetical protein